MAEAVSGGAATPAEGLGGAAAAWSEVVAAAGKAEESERERERVSKLRVSESEGIGLSDARTGQ